MKKVRIIILLMTLLLGIFFIMPAKVFAAGNLNRGVWWNHISQFEFGFAKGEITYNGHIVIVEEPAHEYEGYKILYYGDANWFEPALSILGSLVDDEEDVELYLEENFEDYDGYLYWNFEEEYWQIAYYDTSELGYIQRIEELENEIQQLENEIQQLENQIQQLENENQQLENEISLLEDEIQDLENEISLLENEIQDLEDEIQDLENEKGLLEDEIQDLEDEISSLESQISSLQNIISSLEDEISSLENEIQQLEDALELEYDRGYTDGYEIGYNEGLLVGNNDIDITKWFVPLVVIIIIVGIIEPIILIKRRG